MVEQSPDRPERHPGQVRQSWLERRREKVIAEIQRNRRGEYTVPTWVLAVLLLLFLAGWAALIIFA
jgi:hypothetical protein